MQTPHPYWNSILYQCQVCSAVFQYHCKMSLASVCSVVSEVCFKQSPAQIAVLDSSVIFMWASVLLAARLDTEQHAREWRNPSEVPLPHSIRELLQWLLENFNRQTKCWRHKPVSLANVFTCYRDLNGEQSCLFEHTTFENTFSLSLTLGKGQVC